MAHPTLADPVSRVRAVVPVLRRHAATSEAARALTPEARAAITGATTVFAVHGFDCCLRDARTAVQHTMTQCVNYEIAGKQFVGLDIRDSTWAFDDRGDAG